MNNKEWIKEKIKEWIFGILVGLWFFGLFVLVGLLNGGVI